MRKLTKYGNRKLYDCRESRYITLLEIGELVQSGEDIEVTEKGSGRDITPLVLAQVVAARAGRMPVLPAALYHVLRTHNGPTIEPGDMKKPAEDP